MYLEEAAMGWVCSHCMSKVHDYHATQIHFKFIVEIVSIFHVEYLMAC